LEKSLLKSQQNIFTSLRYDIGGAGAAETGSHQAGREGEERQVQEARRRKRTFEAGNPR